MDKRLRWWVGIEIVSFVVLIVLIASSPYVLVIKALMTGLMLFFLFFSLLLVHYAVAMHEPTVFDVAWITCAVLPVSILLFGLIVVFKSFSIGMSSLILSFPILYSVYRLGINRKEKIAIEDRRYMSRMRRKRTRTLSPREEMIERLRAKEREIERMTIERLGLK